MQRIKHVILALVLVVTAFTAVGRSASAQTTEDRFHDLFITAGYSTAFGAALGAAILSFSDEPATDLRYVAMGASLGFIGGSVLGAYMIFAPMIAATDEPVGSTLTAQETSKKDRAIVIRPVYSTASSRFTQVEAGMTLFRF